MFSGSMRDNPAGRNGVGVAVDGSVVAVIYGVDVDRGVGDVGVGLGAHPFTANTVIAKKVANNFLYVFIIFSLLPCKVDVS